MAALDRRPLLLVLLLLATILAACESGADAGASRAGSIPSGPQGAIGWQPLHDSPLTARYSTHAFWTGKEVLFVGGTDAEPCPPNADCAPPAVAPFRDGAAVDPVSGTWREIADAPLPLGSLTGAIVEETLYVLVTGVEQAPGVRAAFLAYSIADDRWEELAPPPVAGGGSLRLVAAGTRLIGYTGTQENGVEPDLLFDPNAGTWSDLPGDPLAPSFDRAIVWGGSELVLLGLAVVPNPNSEKPAIYRAAAFDLASGAWRRLPDSEVVGWNPAWFWAGGRIVNASIGSADGGEVNNWGRRFPFGGVLAPPAGEWSPLPDPPAETGPYQGLSVGGPEDVVSDDGWVLHVSTGTWTPLPRPPQPADQGEAAVWAGDRLIVWGGVRWMGAGSTLLDHGWAWLP